MLHREAGIADLLGGKFSGMVGVSRGLKCAVWLDVMLSDGDDADKSLGTPDAVLKRPGGNRSSIAVHELSLHA